MKSDQSDKNQEDLPFFQLIYFHGPIIANKSDQQQFKLNED
jgi:hypothetical protein